MKTRANASIILVTLFLFCFVSNVNLHFAAQTSTANQTTAAQAAAELRDFYFKRDYEGGYLRGRKLAEQFPDNMELQAWFVLNTARNELTAEAVKYAAKLVANNKENGWAQFALAHAYIRGGQYKEAFAAAEQAVRIEPENEEFIFLYNSALLVQNRYEELYAWLDKNSARIKDRARLIDATAEAQYRQSTGGKPDEALKKRAFENFAEAARLNPISVSANYIYGIYLNGEKRSAEALPILKKAVALSPTVAPVRREYWRALLDGQPEKSEDDRRAEAVADIDNLVRLRPDSYQVLETASAFYGRELEMPDKVKELEAATLKKFPQTAAAERILIGRIESLYYTEKAQKVGSQKYQQVVAMLREFISRPKHFQENYLGEADRMLFGALKDDPKTTNAELLQIAGDADRHSQFGVEATYAMIAGVLTTRKMFREAEDFVKRGFEKVKPEIEARRDFIKDEKQLEKDLNSMNAALHDALGWIYFKENRLDEAEREIATAIKLDAEKQSFYNKQAQVYEAKNELDKAETAYINAYSTFWGKGNPYVESLKTLYRKRVGNLKGFDEYFVKVKETERAIRKQRVLSAKIADPQNAAAFNLKNLAGKPLALADLKGKIVVVNIWGTWCGPCVMELPEFQELHAKYAGANDVAILTINNDEDAAEVKKFMIGKKYDFNVLRDENYLRTTGINTFPTTWFIDRQGKIAFIKVGSSDKLLEEFGWRIEELRKQNAGK